MKDSEDEKIAKSWIKLKLTKYSDPSFDNLFWSYEKIDELISKKPIDALKVILKISDLIDTDELLDLLGAGPIEDLMFRNGEAVIKQIETETKYRPKFKTALKTVQIDPSETPKWVWKRFYEIAETEPYSR